MPPNEPDDWRLVTLLAFALGLTVGAMMYAGVILLTRAVPPALI